MPARWEICNNVLVIKSDLGVIYPNSTMVYYATNGDYSLLPKDFADAENPKEAIDNLRFSTIAVPLRVELILDEKQNIVLRLFCIKRNEKVEVLLKDGHIIDHAILDGVWFPISGNITELEELFATSTINDSGIISIKQYVKLIESDVFNEDSKIENHVNIEEIKRTTEEAHPVPSELKATLFPYQTNGYNWLCYMLDQSEGCILGDEMGLGKTMQVIATILYLKTKGDTPILVVAPVSLLANWQRECAKFAPSLNVFLHYGNHRTGNYRDLLNYDVIVSAYSTVVSDIYMLNMIEWRLVVLDEAQNIKNPYSQRTKSCKSLNRDRSIAVSGTPFENHMSDIWSLMDFILPGVFGSLQTYKDKIPDDAFGGQLFEPILTPLMLRRLVQDVAKDLPEKVVSSQPIIMSQAESMRYADYLNEARDKAESESLNLGVLQKLRMFCTHPCITEDTPTSTDPAEQSLKYQRLCELMDEIIERREKVLVFTSYKKMFDVFTTDLPRRFGIKVWTINGETPVAERQTIVDQFNSLPYPAALILNPVAGGTGLNITGANHVIHYNLEWNPSLEDQSSARAYRRGQQKTVFVYRLYYKDTVEQIVNERIERKRDTAKAAVVGNEGINLDRQDIIKALEIFPSL